MSLQCSLAGEPHLHLYSALGLMACQLLWMILLYTLGCQCPGRGWIASSRRTTSEWQRPSCVGTGSGLSMPARHTLHLSSAFPHTFTLSPSCTPVTVLGKVGHVTGLSSLVFRPVFPEAGLMQSCILTTCRLCEYRCRLCT